MASAITVAGIAAVRRRLARFGGLLASIALAEGEGIYAAFRLHPFTIAQIEAWAGNNGLADRLIDPKELHVTTVYSKRPFPMEAVGRRPIQAKYIGFDLFGREEKDMLVALLDAPELHELFQQRRGDGMQYDFPEYKPHVSLVKGMTQQELERLQPIDFPIQLVEEYSKALDEDFSYDKKENSGKLAESAIARLSYFMARADYPLSTDEYYNTANENVLRERLPKAESYYERHDIIKELRRRGVIEARVQPVPIDKLAPSTLRNYLSWRATSGKPRPRYSRVEIVKELERRGLKVPKRRRKKYL